LPEIDRLHEADKNIEIKLASLLEIEKSKTEVLREVVESQNRMSQAFFSLLIACVLGLTGIVYKQHVANHSFHLKLDKIATTQKDEEEFEDLQGQRDERR
jgi:hypothetical protein